MKTIILFALFLVYSGASAQFTFNSSFNPVPGNTFLNVDADTNHSEGSAGANQTWNFSSAVFTGSSNYTEFVAPGATPNGSSYPAATVANGYFDQATGYSYFTYFQASGSALTILGASLTSPTLTYNIPFTNPMTWFSYPLSYSGTFSDTYSGTSSATYNGVTANLKRRGTNTVTYDGYGTLILPSGTVNNAARLKSVQVVTDSIVVGQFTVSVKTTTTTIYEWYKQNYRFPMMDITYTTTLEQGQTFTSKQVFFVQDAGVGITNNNISTVNDYKLNNNYPNPFNPSTNIRFAIPKEEFVTLKIFNSVGQEVAELVSQKMNAGDYTYTFDAGKLSSGIYFYTLQAGSFVETKRMTLVK